MHHRPVLELDGARLVAQLLQKANELHRVLPPAARFPKLRRSRSPPGSARATGVADRNTDGGVLRRPKVSPLVRDPRCVRRVHATREVKAARAAGRGDLQVVLRSSARRAKLAAVDAKRCYAGRFHPLDVPTSGRARGLWAASTRSRRWPRVPRAPWGRRWLATPPSRRGSRLATRRG